MIHLSVINPYIRLAIPSVINQTIHRRIIYDYELIYVADGDFTFIYDDVPYPCTTGQFILIRLGVPHSFTDFRRDLVQPHIHFDVTHAGDSERVPICFKDRAAMTEAEAAQIREDVFADYPKTPFVTFADTPRARQVFDAVVGQGNVPPLYRKARFMELLEMLIADNFRGLLEAEGRALPVEQQIKDYLDSGQSYTATLGDLARHFNYSKYYLDHRFKQRYGQGIVAYRNHRRLQVARELLHELGVTAVAERLGFSSIYAFSRAFKNHYGVAPSDVKCRFD